MTKAKKLSMYVCPECYEDGEFFRVADVQKVISDRLNHLKNWKDVRTDKDNKIEMTKMESAIYILGEVQGVFK